MIETSQDGRITRWYARKIAGRTHIAAIDENGKLVFHNDVGPEPAEPITGDDRYAFLSAVAEFLRNPGGEPGGQP
jgi:hypothetical protein